jgi:hypothetical protein
MSFFNDISNFFNDAFQGFKDVVTTLYTDAKGAVFTVYYNIDNRLKGITNTVEDTYKTVTHGTVDGL